MLVHRSKGFGSPALPTAGASERSKPNFALLRHTVATRSIDFGTQRARPFLA
jgi:hypothetical protein